MADRSNAGAQQMRRRMDRAAGEDDLVASELLFAAADQRLHADAARALEHQFLDHGVGRDRQVGALARLAIEIPHRGGDALLGLIGMRHRKITVDELAVLVGQEGVARLLARFGDRQRVFRPVLFRNAANGNAAVLAVIRPVEIEVALDLLEIGQHVLPAPARGSPRFPFVVVGRRAAVGHLAVDRRAAAQHARLLVFAQWRTIGLRIVVADDLGRDLQLGPVETRIEIGRARIAVADLLRLLARRRVLAGLQEKDFSGALGGETVGHDRSCRTAADDNGVVHFRVSSFCFVRADRLAQLCPWVTRALRTAKAEDEPRPGRLWPP